MLQVVKESLISGYVEEYLEERTIEGLSPKSIRLYRVVLSDLARYLGGDLEQLTSRNLKSYMAELHRREYKKASLSLYNTVVRIFCAWLVQNGYLSSSPMDSIPKYKRGKRFPEHFSDEQIRAMLAICGTTWTGRRTRVMLLTLVGTGLRASELASLRLSSLDLQAGLIRVVGKGDKERLVPISASLYEELIDWLNIRSKFLGGKHHPSLFVTKLGGAPTLSSIYSLIKRLGARAGIDTVRCSPHTCRHTFATRFIASGGDVFLLQDILGHSSINTTLIYVHVSGQRIRTAFDRIDPLGGLLWATAEDGEGPEPPTPVAVSGLRKPLPLVDLIAA